jgi:hypothetical protein
VIRRPTILTGERQWQPLRGMWPRGSSSTPRPSSAGSALATCTFPTPPTSTGAGGYCGRTIASPNTTYAVVHQWRNRRRCHRERRRSVSADLQHRFTQNRLRRTATPTAPSWILSRRTGSWRRSPAMSSTAVSGATHATGACSPSAIHTRRQSTSAQSYRARNADNARRICVVGGAVGGRAKSDAPC